MFRGWLQEDFIDSESDIGNEIEYKMPDQKRLKRQGQAYEEAERKGIHGFKREDRGIIDIY